jgi:hypothetical protein
MEPKGIYLIKYLIKYLLFIITSRWIKRNPKEKENDRVTPFLLRSYLFNFQEGIKMKPKGFYLLYYKGTKSKS